MIGLSLDESGVWVWDDGTLYATSELSTTLTPPQSQNQGARIQFAQNLEPFFDFNDGSWLVCQI